MTAHQAPLSLGFSRQEYWSGLPFPSPMHACMLSRVSHVRLCETLWTAAHEAPLSTGFSRQKYWSGLPFPSSKISYRIFKKLTISYPVSSYFIREWSLRKCKDQRRGESTLLVLEIAHFCILFLVLSTVGHSNIWINKWRKYTSNSLIRCGAIVFVHELGPLLLRTDFCCCC